MTVNETDDNAVYVGQPDISLPVFVTILAGTSIIVLVIVAYCTWRCWRTKHLDHSLTNTPEQSFQSLRNINLKISQSTPDLIDSSDSKNDYITEERIGKNMYKTVLRQTTLPTVPQRHQSFQRQLSHKLDLSNIEFTIQKVKYKEQPQFGKIKPELYRQTAIQSAPGGVNTKMCGKLAFTLSYSHELESLMVNVLKAVDLPAKDFSGTSDPYVKLYLLPERRKKYQTKVHRKTLNPDFNEHFAFSVPYKELADRILQFSIYDFDRFSRHDLIGIVMVKDMLLDNDLSKENEYICDIISVQQEKLDLGELLMSLCYLPTAGRLTVTVIKARNLKAMDISGTSDPYVKVALMCQGKRIKKKKTSVIKNTLFPIYNEAIVFDVPQENVEDVSLVIKVIDYDRVGSNEIMGCCAVGPLYVGIGRDHWFEMLENSRKPIAQWYPLLETVPGASPPDQTPNGKTKSSHSSLSDQSHNNNNNIYNK